MQRLKSVNSGGQGAVNQEEEISIKELVRMMVMCLVDNPGDVLVNEVKGDYTLLFEVSVHPEDMPRALGKNGVNAEAIRTLLKAMGGKVGYRYLIGIINPCKEG